MTIYIARRVLIGLLLLLILSFMFFVVTYVITTNETSGVRADPSVVRQQHFDARLRRLGLDREWYAAYPPFVLSLVRGDLGDSYSTGERVTARLAQRLPNSVLLFGTALVVSLTLGIPLGVFAATHQYSRVDMFVSVLTYIGVSIPSFVLSIFLLLLFAVFLRASPLEWGFPLFGMHTAGQDDPADLLVHMVLPVTALAVPLIATFSRFMRASMLEVLHQDYVRTGLAKGLPARVVNYKHALRNAIIPIITLVALAIPTLVSGTVIIEGIFSWPGMGNLAFNAAINRDYPMVLGILLVVGSLTVVLNLVADVLYAVVDPRIRY
ncbi:MAG: ABC transporter permease [Candidatus Dormibacteraeota bacterium]|nr:ABC transporter permease [Candidatus Dormibacteraeota bacterium]